MIDSGSVPARPARSGSGRGAWVVVLAMAVGGSAAAEVFCHEEHAADERCAVCQLPHQPAAEASGSSELGLADVAEPLEQAAPDDWIASGHIRRHPARGPPA